MAEDTSNTKARDSRDAYSEDAVAEGISDDTVARTIVKKQDRNLMPLLFAVYLLSFLDRSNIGYAYSCRRRGEKT